MRRFNIRVYGLWVINGKEILVSEENIKGTKVIKFPGGGLEFGEGTIDGLKREWQEELDMIIEVTAHFYTTDFFQPSAWDDSQVVSIYYLVKPLRDTEFPYYNGKENFYFLPLHHLPNRLNLPIDKIVAKKLTRWGSDEVALF